MVGTLGTGEGRDSKETWRQEDQLLDFKLHDIQPRYLPPHLLTHMVFPTGVWPRGRGQRATRREADPDTGFRPSCHAPEQVV